MNTIVADKAGNALYADIGAIPQRAERAGAAVQHRARHRDLPAARAAGARRLARRRATGAATPTPREPGLFGPSQHAALFRADYVTNSNDSYWLSNPKQPLEGFARIIGDERTARTLRTRIGLIMTQARDRRHRRLGPPRLHAPATCSAWCSATASTAASSSRDDARVDVPRLLRRHGAQLDRARSPSATPATCSPRGTCTRTSTRAARCCSAASGSARSAPRRRRGRTPFDATDPVNTPNALDTREPAGPVGVRRRDLNDLRGANIPLDAPLGRRPVHDARTARGSRSTAAPATRTATSTRSTSAWTPARASTDVEHGSSYVQVVTWNNGALPRRADDPDLLGVDQPDVAALRRPDQAVLAQALGARAVLPPRRPRGHKAHDPDRQR